MNLKEKARRKDRRKVKRKKTYSCVREGWRRAPGGEGGIEEIRKNYPGVRARWKKGKGGREKEREGKGTMV